MYENSLRETHFDTRAVILNCVQFCPYKTFGNLWRDFWVSEPGWVRNAIKYFMMHKTTLCYKRFIQSRLPRAFPNRDGVRAAG